MPRERKTSARGYGSSHQRLRAAWVARVEAGGVICARCGFGIAPGAKWDLGHSDVDRAEYTGPEHARCNRRAGGRAGAAASRRGRPAEVAQWRRFAREPAFQDDPAKGIYFSPPWSTGTPGPWSQAWFDWRAEVLR